MFWLGLIIGFIVGYCVCAVVADKEHKFEVEELRKDVKHWEQEANSYLESWDEESNKLEKTIQELRSKLKKH